MAEEKILDIEIITPQKTIHSGQAVSISLPGSLSPFQVLYNHAPIISSLDIGLVKIIDSNQNKLFFATSSGFAEVRKNKISVLVENAVEAGSIDIAKETESLKKAQEQIKVTKDPDESSALAALINETQNKIRAAEKLRE
jgi:F-type H+-transporting ATPase subunit epsilon